MNMNVYTCFIDYRKAFDMVRHNKLIEVLRSTSIDEHDINIITELYWNQNAEIRVEYSTSESVAIRRGVRQGCVLSPLLFNIYAEAVFHEAIHDSSGGIKINGTLINNIWYADDTVVLAGSPIKLQQLMDEIVQRSEAFGLSLNTAKTKTMVFSKHPVTLTLRVSDENIEQVSSIKYLGTILNDNGNINQEIRSKIEQARRSFLDMKNVFTRKELNLDLRVRMLRCYIFSMLLYGCESWTLSPETERKITSFEMYLYRRILKIPWILKITNEEVLRRMGKQTELLSTLKKRKIEYLGHIIRGEKYEILRIIMEGKIEGRRSVGRRRNSWLKDIRRWLGVSTVDIFRAAGSKILIALWIANLQ